MTKQTMAALLLAVFSTTTFAADQAATSAQIKLSLLLIDQDQVLLASTVSTRDGVPVPITVSREVSYVAAAALDRDSVKLTPGITKAGFYATMTPALTKDGRIEIDISATHSDVARTDSVARDHLPVEWPQATSARLKRSVTLDNGKPALIPFGPQLSSSDAAKGGAADQKRYALVLTATKE